VVWSFSLAKCGPAWHDASERLVVYEAAHRHRHSKNLTTILFIVGCDDEGDHFFFSRQKRRVLSLCIGAANHSNIAKP